MDAGDGEARQQVFNAQRQAKMAARKDYYKVLEIPKTANQQEIKVLLSVCPFLFVRHILSFPFPSFVDSDSPFLMGSDLASLSQVGHDISPR